MLLPLIQETLLAGDVVPMFVVEGFVGVVQFKSEGLYSRRGSKKSPSNLLAVLICVSKAGPDLVVCCRSG